MSKELVYVEVKKPNRQLTTEQFITKVESKYPNRFTFEKTVYLGKEKHLTITCKTHGDLHITPDQFRWNKEGCPSCTKEIPRNRDKQKYIDRANEIHGSYYDYSRVVYVNSSEKVEIGCPAHGSFFQSLYDHAVRATKCPECSFIQRTKDNDYFKQKAEEVHGIRYDYSKVVYRGVGEKVIIGCKDHGDFEQRAGSHLQGNGCLKCFNENVNRSNKEEFEKQAKEIHGNKYDYSKVIYLGNKIPVEIICPSHGSFWQKPNSHLSSKCGCKRCNESHGERKICMILDTLAIPYLREYKIDGFNYRFDFFLPDQNILIEFHGYQHYYPVEAFGGRDELEKTQYRDNQKVILAHDKGFILTCVNYRHFEKGLLEQTLLSKLKKIYIRWYLIDGKIMVFKKIIDVYKHFDIPTNIEIRYMDDEVKKRVKDFKVLF